MSRRLYNSCLPVSRLPVELLSTIFGLCAPPEDGAVAQMQKLEWIAFSHVCYHWRAVALNTPSLWTRIDFQFPRFVEEFVKRSQSLPLSVYAFLDEMNVCTPEDEEHEYLFYSQAFRLVVPHIHRMRFLFIMVYQDLFMRDMVPLLSARAPLLEELTIVCYFGYAEDHDGGLITSLFETDTSSLLRLSLEASCISKNAFNFRKLTGLRIHESGFPSEWYWDTILDCLDAMPSLDILALYMSLPTAEEPIDARTIDMSRIKELHVKDVHDRVVMFLGHLLLQHGVNLRLDLKNENPHRGAIDWSELAPVVPSVAHLFGVTHDCSLQRLQICIKTWVIVRAWSTIEKSRNPDLELKFMCSRAELQTVWSNLFRGTWLSKVLLVVVDATAEDFPPDAWNDLFSYVPNMAEVEATRSSSSSFLTALSIDTALSSQAHGCSLPGLTTVTLRDHIPSDDPVSNTDVFEHNFGRRGRLGVPLDDLRLVNWGPITDVPRIAGVKSLVTAADDGEEGRLCDESIWYDGV